MELAQSRPERALLNKKSQRTHYLCKKAYLRARWVQGKSKDGREDHPGSEKHRQWKYWFAYQHGSKLYAEADPNKERDIKTEVVNPS